MRALIASMIIALAVSVTGCSPAADDAAAPDAASEAEDAEGSSEE